MELRRGIILILVMATIASVAIVPCYSEEKKSDKVIWEDDEQRGPGPGGGPGRGGPGRGERGPGRGDRGGPGRFRSREDEVNRFLEELKESNPKKAEELEKLRKNNPDKFREELGKAIRENWNKRFESWKRRWRAEFIEWLQEAAPKVAGELSRLKETDTDTYAKKYEIVREKYWRIYEESKRNPELAQVLLADIELDERQEALLKEIKATKSEREKKQLMSQLEEVVGNKYDLIIRRKQIAYESLLRRIAQLQEELNKSREEIINWQNVEIKTENVKQRLKELTEKPPKFRWR